VKITLRADLKPSYVVPPLQTWGVGLLKASYELSTRTLIYCSTYSVLNGATLRAVFYGPADSSHNAPMIFEHPTDDLATPILGARVLTSDQSRDLLGGNWYFQIHSHGYPQGQLRGQIHVFSGTPLPSTDN
jgi:hypothetical protein